MLSDIKKSEAFHFLITLKAYFFFIRLTVDKYQKILSKNYRVDLHVFN